VPGSEQSERGSVAASARGHGLELAVLGPLQLVVDGRHVAVPGTRRRATLALLAMASPGPISFEQLVDAVWPDDVPRSGRAALQSHISRLRRHLGPHADRLTSVEGGYRLELGPGELDAHRFDTLVREARGTGDRAATREALTRALALWRGPALADLGDVAPLGAWARALSEARIDASDALVRWALDAGDTVTAVAVASDAIEAEPLREPTAILLARALAADGRPAEALRVAHAFRVRLGEETGLEPSPELAELERAIAAGGASGSRSHRDHGATPLPAAATALLGREAELAGLARLLDAERLITVVGPGGVGKTHLAIEAARSAGPGYHHVHLLRLAPLLDGSAVPTVLEGVLGLDPGIGPGDPIGRCAERLRSGRQLLVVDCCEHVLDAVRTMIPTLLETCPDLTVLTTSRERLALPAEQTCRLAPLPMPSDAAAQDLAVGRAEIPSVALFLDRTRRARPDLDIASIDLNAVSRIVRRLDGMPLAIELAAGRMASLGLADLEGRLDRALDLLGTTSQPSATANDLRPGDDRHRTLRAAVAWSYDLLSPSEQALFRHLASFPDGVDLSTAEQVAADLGLPLDPATTLAHLVDASMVEADLTGPTTRYRMLDTLRAFGLDRLESEGEAEAATERLVRWGRELTSWLSATSMTDDEPSADVTLRAELANLRAAWRTARERGDLDTACAMVIDLNDLVAWRDVTEIWGWVRELAEDRRLSGHPLECATLGVAAEATWFSTGDLDQAETLASRAVALLDGGTRRTHMAVSWAMADVSMFRGRFEEAKRWAWTSREGTPLEAEAHALIALVHTYADELDAATERLERATTLDAPPTIRGFLRYAEGELSGRRGDWHGAEVAYRAALDAAAATGASFLDGVASVGLVSARARLGRTAEALDGYRQLIDRWERTGGWTQQWTTLRNLADLLDTLGDDTSARELRVAADAAPEAAALGPGAPDRGGVDTIAVDREQVLALARTAIDRARASHRT
jgi:predicted ATPase/DNA-binding SARP family transcriptional activator